MREKRGEEWRGEAHEKPNGARHAELDGELHEARPREHELHTRAVRHAGLRERPLVVRVVDAERRVRALRERRRVLRAGAAAGDAHEEQEQRVGVERRAVVRLLADGALEGRDRRRGRDAERELRAVLPRAPHETRAPEWAGAGAGPAERPDVHFDGPSPCRCRRLSRRRTTRFQRRFGSILRT